MSTPSRVLLDGLEIQRPDERIGDAAPIVTLDGIHGSKIMLSDATLGRHILFLGGIGTGKTTAIDQMVQRVRSQMNDRDCMVIFDTKGDYYRHHYRPGDITLSQRAGRFEGQVRWNALSDAETLMNPDSVEDVLGPLFRNVRQEAGDNNQIWASMAQDLVVAAIVALARERNTSPDLSHADIRRIADTFTQEDYKELLSRHLDLKGASQYVSKDGNIALSTQVFVQQAIRKSLRGEFALPGDFSVRNFIEHGNGRALFLEYDIAEKESSEIILGAFLDTLIREALRRRENDAFGRIFFILDEFALLPDLEYFDTGLNFGRSLGLRFIAGAQNANQVRAAYGEDVGTSILSGFSSLFAFRLFDEASRKLVRDRYGSNRVAYRFESILKNRGFSEVLVEASTIEDWHLSALSVGQTIACLPMANPAFFQFAPFQVGRKS